MTHLVAFDDAAFWPVLLLAPLLALRLRQRARGRHRLLSTWGGPSVASLAATPRRRWETAFFLCAIASASVAIVGPRWGKGGAPPTVTGTDTVLCLDVSRSMEVADLEPNRLEFARWEIRRLAATAHGHRLGLVVFAGEARLVSPLTRDMDAFAAMVDRAGPYLVDKGGTDIGAALTKAAEALDRVSSESGRILLITDGEDLVGKGRSVARTLARRGLRIDCLGVGTESGGPVPLPEGGWVRDRKGDEVVSRLIPDTLEAIVDVMDGVYRSSGSSPGELLRLFREGNESWRKDQAVAKRRERLAQRRPFFAWGALFCILVAWALRGGGRR